MFYEFNQMASPKGLTLLNYLSTMIENIDKFDYVNYSDIDAYGIMHLFNDFLSDKNPNYRSNNDIKCFLFKIYKY